MIVKQQTTVQIGGRVRPAHTKTGHVRDGSHACHQGNRSPGYCAGEGSAAGAPWYVIFTALKWCSSHWYPSLLPHSAC